MKKYRLPISLSSILFLLIFLSFHKGKDPGPYTVHIQQGKSVIEIDEAEQVIHLKPEQFRLLFQLKNIEGVFLSTSFNAEYYELRKRGEIRDWPWIKPKTMAEYPNNPEHELLVDDESFCYWWVDEDGKSHRFDEKVRFKDDVALASRTVDRLWNVDTKEVIALNECSDSLYLFFFHLEEDKEGEPIRASWRKKAVIVFEDE